MRILFTTFEGGGHVPPALVMAEALRRRRHDVLVISDEANRIDAEAMGLRFGTWVRAPNRKAKGAADDPLQDWRRRWPPGIVKSVVRSVLCGPAAAYAADTRDRIEVFRPDLIITNELLLGVMVAAESAAVPIAALTANVWCFPTRSDVPPFGPGWAPARSPHETRREAVARRWIAAWYDAGLGDLNAARASLGLPPLARTLDQLATLERVVLGTSAAFDFGASPAPPPFVHAGRLLPEPDLRLAPHVRDWIDRGGAQVLVSFSTTYQGQAPVLSRCIRALERLGVRALVTTGPAVDVTNLPRAPNVLAVSHASHDALMGRMDLMISHGGHGTVIRALAAGTPVLCLPMGRDHPDNARRIVERGAGLTLSRGASSASIARAASRLLGEERYAAGARRLARALAVDPSSRDRALDALETLAGRVAAEWPHPDRGREGLGPSLDAAA